MPSHTPLVSICIPCFNAEEFLLSAVNTALAQTWSNLEVIVVNDGSTDGSKHLLKSLHDNRLKIIHQANAGQCAAANRALADAQGEYIKFLDADDLLHPHVVERQMERLQCSTSNVASSGWGRFYNNDLQTFRLNVEPVWQDMTTIDWLTESWATRRPMMQCALWLIPRQVLKKSGGWSEDLSLINDFEFFTRVLVNADQVLFTPDCPLMYRSGIVGSLSGQKSDNALRSQYQSLLLGTQHLIEKRNDNRTRSVCANLLQDFVYDIYPRLPLLQRAMKTRIEELGGSCILPGGPPNFHRLRRLIGWKMARRIQRTLGR